MLTGFGVDEAWTTGVLLAEGVLELLQATKPFTRENLAQAFEERRRNSWLEKEAHIAEKSRDGFQSGVVTGLIGMAVAAFSGGRLIRRKPSCESHRAAGLSGGVLSRQTQSNRDCENREGCLFNFPRRFRPRSADGPLRLARDEYDGSLLVPHQDVLLMGGKVQAAADTPTTLSFAIWKCAAGAVTSCASRCVPDRLSPGAWKACLASTARSASSVAPACGIVQRPSTAKPICRYGSASGDCAQPKTNGNFRKELKQR